MSRKPLRPLSAHEAEAHSRVELNVDLEMYQEARRYAVPRRLIEAATERRLAGDTAGAFAAAAVDLDVDLSAAAAHGPEIAEQVADDLRHLASDLLRWNVPRMLNPRGGVVDRIGVLRRYPVPGEGHVTLTVERGDGADPSRPVVRLMTATAGAAPTFRGYGKYRLHPAFWDVRRTGGLRALCGGADRIPFFHPDGRRLAVDELPDGPRPDDPVAHAEWLALLWDHERIGEALTACGIIAGEDALADWRIWPPIALERLVAAARDVLDSARTRSGGDGREAVWLDEYREYSGAPDLHLSFEADGTVSIGHRYPRPDEERFLSMPEYRHPVDFELLRFGRLEPDDLHPLVRRALFPALESDPRNSSSSAESGGQADLLARAQYGDSAGVIELLEAGVDPAVHTDRGRSLLHLLPVLDHEALLPRLLAAGLDVNALDDWGQTPLHAAMEGAPRGMRHTSDLVRRLRALGGIDTCKKRGLPCSPHGFEEPEGQARDDRPAAPSDGTLDHARSAASRSDARTMARLARVLYAAGASPREVLRECHEVDFPDEFFLIADHLLDDRHAFDFTVQPWLMAGPPRRGRAASHSHLDEWAEEQILAHDRDLVPLVELRNRHATHGGMVLCYRLGELRAGRSTVFGISPFDLDAGVERCGASLLDVLLTYHVELERWLGRRGEAARDEDRAADHWWAAAIEPALAHLRRWLPGQDPAIPHEEDPIPSLRAAASRADFYSMALLARALYRAGKGPREVLRECYGVDFPDEFFVLAEARPELAMEFTDQPWQLAVPLDRGGPPLRPGPRARVEKQILALEPDLLPVFSLYADYRHAHGDITSPPPARHGGLLICYRLGDLREGRSAAYGVPRISGREKADELTALDVVHCGTSLFDVLHEHFADRHDLDEWESSQPWNRGAGSIDDEEVDASLEVVQEIEALRRRL
ncbi:hypothetical protein [Actinomadura terrae]|uniref:hypothetical protein n=1 Tax=Actinomadura terrae TaxID=604353 RepID=UPI001FA802FB|nr:hypothetical protein [Actinomadura terrae]